jgi:glyoxylase I family protein
MESDRILMTTKANVFAARERSIQAIAHPIRLEGGEGDKAMRIHHVAIICSDYEQSKKFYVEVLGFPIIQETFRKERNSFKLDLKVSETEQIELFSFPNPPKRVNDPEACGLRHLAFEVDDIKASVSQLQAKGISVETIRIDEITGKKFTFFRDPDGLPLEFYEK